MAVGWKKLHQFNFQQFLAPTQFQFQAIVTYILGAKSLTFSQRACFIAVFAVTIMLRVGINKS